jgi:flagellar hook-basal body complex protein FliE
MSVSEVMAIRNTILARNVSLQNAAKAAPIGGGGDQGPGSTFDVAMNQALRAVDGSDATASRSGIGVPAVASSEQTGLGSTFQTALQKLNGINAEAGALTTAYERGEETDIAKVMLARQRAGIGFEATLQVRNKVLSAYKDIMSMAI